jgi:hypothetical protein
MTAACVPACLAAWPFRCSVKQAASGVPWLPDAACCCRCPGMPSWETTVRDKGGCFSHVVVICLMLADLAPLHPCTRVCASLAPFAAYACVTPRHAPTHHRPVSRLWRSRRPQAPRLRQLGPRLLLQPPAPGGPVGQWGARHCPWETLWGLLAAPTCLPAGTRV